MTHTTTQEAQDTTLKSKDTVYFPEPLKRRLVKFAQQRRISQNSVMVAALEQFLDPGVAAQQEAAMARRLDRIDRRINAMNHNTEILAEMQALYIKTFLLYTQPPPAQYMDAAKSRSDSAWKGFCNILSGNLGAGRTLFEDFPLGHPFRPQDFTQPKQQEPGEEHDGKE